MNSLLNVELDLHNAAQEANRFVTEDLPGFSYPDRFSGRGIVIVGGGMRYLVCAWVLIRVLRRHGCPLPIQVWYLGQRERDLGWEKLVAPYGVECVDAWALRDSHPQDWLFGHRRLNGWEAKAYATLHCPFEEVLLLDADNVPVADPAYLFELPEYQATGAIFWPDLGRLAPERAAWKVFGDIPYRDEPEVESGQVVIDKRRCWQAVVLMHWYMQNAEFYFDQIHGDKEIFHLAWRKLDLEYAMPKTPTHLDEVGLYQHDFEGKLIFQHRSVRKWNLDDNARQEGFLLEEECLTYLEEARLNWDTVFERNGSQDREDKELQRSLEGCRFHYRIIGHGSRPMVLARGGRVGEGAMAFERYWWIENRKLVIAGDGKLVTMTLRAQRNGSWVGRWNVGDCVPVVLVPYFPDPYEFTGPYELVFERLEETTDRRHIFTLYELYKRLPPGSRCLEIGCLDGATATAIVEAIRQGADIYADFCDLEITQELRQVLAACPEQGRIRIHESSSVEVLRRQLYDVYYVDGDHSWAGVADELSLILPGRPLLFMAHDTATGKFNPHCPGPLWFKMAFQCEPGYYCLEDHACRDNEATERGLLVATRDGALFEAAQQAFARWLMA